MRYLLHTTRYRLHEASFSGVLTAHTAFLAGGVFYDVFPNVKVFQVLEVLTSHWRSLRANREISEVVEAEWRTCGLNIDAADSEAY